jgi:hypothetical protein
MSFNDHIKRTPKTVDDAKREIKHRKDKREQSTKLLELTAKRIGREIKANRPKPKRIGVTRQIKAIFPNWSDLNEPLQKMQIKSLLKPLYGEQYFSVEKIIDKLTESKHLELTNIVHFKYYNGVKSNMMLKYYLPTEKALRLLKR